MIRYAKYALPYIWKSRKHGPVKIMAGLAISYISLAIGLVFILVAGFIWTAKIYGIDSAFFVTGLILTVTAGLYLITVKLTKARPAQLPANIDTDPLAAHIPTSLRENPSVQKLLEYVAENPVASTATAVTIGMLISRELLED